MVFSLAGKMESVKSLNGGMTGSDLCLRKSKQATGIGCWIAGSRMKAGKPARRLSKEAWVICHEC